MKEQLTSLELMLIVKELRKEILGARVDKIYDYGKKLRFVLYKEGTKELFIDPGYKLYLTRYKFPSPPTPSNFCMFLRKYLLGKRIQDIIQRSYERVVEIKFDYLTLMVELFSKEKGNVILIDEEQTILQPQEIQIWKDRRVIQKEAYRYPPAGINLFSLDYLNFQRAARSTDKELVRFLAADMGLGGNYAEEVCLLAEVSKDAKTNLLKEELARLYRIIKFLFERAVQPQLVFRDEEPVDVVPFPFKTYRNLKAKPFSSMNEAFDAFFTEKEMRRLEEETKEKIEEEKERRQRILEQQEEVVEKTEERAEKKTRADLIYENYGLVESVLSSIQKAIHAGVSWDDIKRRASSEDSDEARAIKEIREHQGTVVLVLDGEELELDFKKSVEENAEDFYEDTKKTIKEPVEIEERPTIEKRVEKPRNWYERFRWFVSSTGQLVVAGKDAASNEVLINKYMEPTDIVLHADIQGSPFALVKTKAPSSVETSQTIKEAGEFVASYSKAWQLNLQEAEVFWALPEQVSKSTFMVQGKRNYLKRAETRLAIGIKIAERQIVSGPVLAISKNTKYFVTIQPGYTNSRQLAEKIKRQWLLKAREEDKPVISAAPLDEIQRLIPAERGDLVEY